MTPETSMPDARRVRRPSLRDPRLGVGLLLVAGSVALGTWAVAGADTGEDLYVARTVLTPGRALTAEDLSVVRARVPDGAQTYLPAGEAIPDGVVVTRLVGEGELVPAAAVGTGAEVDVRPVSVSVTGPVSADVEPGARVDLWLTERPSAVIGQDAPPPAPVLVAGSMRVADVRSSDDALLAGSAGTTVEVLVADADLPAVLAALATDGAVTLVPVPGGA